LASRGLRKLEANEEKIEEIAELKQVRRQAQWVIMKAFLVALALTLIAFILP
jgi:hypothetical protein